MDRPIVCVNTNISSGVFAGPTRSLGQTLFVSDPLGCALQGRTVVACRVEVSLLVLVVDVQVQ